MTPRSKPVDRRYGAKPKVFYLHTLDGRPAAFDGMHVCFAQPESTAKVPLCRSLRELHKQQSISARNRAACHLERYGHIKVVLP